MVGEESNGAAEKPRAATMVASQYSERTRPTLCCLLRMRTYRLPPHVDVRCHVGNTSEVLIGEVVSLPQPIDHRRLDCVDRKRRSPPWRPGIELEARYTLVVDDFVPHEQHVTTRKHTTVLVTQPLVDLSPSVILHEVRSQAVVVPARPRQPRQPRRSHPLADRRRQVRYDADRGPPASCSRVARSRDRRSLAAKSL